MHTLSSIIEKHEGIIPVDSTAREPRLIFGIVELHIIRWPLGNHCLYSCLDRIVTKISCGRVDEGMGSWGILLRGCETDAAEDDTNSGDQPFPCPGVVFKSHRLFNVGDISKSVVLY